MEKAIIRFSRGGRIIEYMQSVQDPDFPKLKVFENVNTKNKNDWQNALFNAVDGIYAYLSNEQSLYVCTFMDGLNALKWTEKALESAKQPKS